MPSQRRARKPSTAAGAEVPGIIERVDSRFVELQAAWEKAHREGAPCFTQPQLVAAIADSVDFIENGLRAAAQQAGVSPVALLPRSGACSLATALSFLPEGGVMIDMDTALASDFFAHDGPVRSAMPDFLGDPAVTGRAKLPPSQLHEVFLPRAANWFHLSLQTACFVEQLAWLLLDPQPTSSQAAADSSNVPAEPEPAQSQCALAAAADAMAEELASSAEAVKPAKPTRRQRQKEAARRKLAEAATAAASAANGNAIETTSPTENNLGALAHARDKVRHDGEAVDIRPADDLELKCINSTCSISTKDTQAEDRSLLNRAEEIHAKCRDDASCNHVLDDATLAERERCKIVEGKMRNHEHIRNESRQTADGTDTNALSSNSHTGLHLHLLDQSVNEEAAATAAASASEVLEEVVGIGEVHIPEHPDSVLQEDALSSHSKASLPALSFRGSPTAYELNAATWNSRDSAAEACQFNFCEVNTASIGSQRPPWLGPDANSRAWPTLDAPDDPWRELNGASWSSRGSCPDNDALNLCEINTASWNSTGSHARWMTSWNPRGANTRTVRSVQDIMSDLSMFSGLAVPGESGTSVPSLGTEASGVLAHGYPLLTAEALATLSGTSEVGSAEGSQRQQLLSNTVGPSGATPGTMPQFMHHNHNRLHHNEYFPYQNSQHHQSPQQHQHAQHHTPQLHHAQQHHQHFQHQHQHHSHQHYQHQHQHHQHHQHLQQAPSFPPGLPPVPEGSKSTNFEAEASSSSKLSLLEQRVNSDKVSRDKRQYNLRWRLWAMSGKTGNGPNQSISHPAEGAEVAADPMSPGSAHAGSDGGLYGELDTLSLRESRWERHRANAAQRFAELATSQRIWRQGLQRVIQFWRPQRHRSHSPSGRFALGRDQAVRQHLPWAATRSTSPPDIAEGFDARGGTAAVPAIHSAVSAVHCEQRGTSSQVSQPASTNLPPTTTPASGQPSLEEEHVFVAIPKSRLEAVTRLLASDPEQLAPDSK